MGKNLYLSILHLNHRYNYHLMKKIALLLLASFLLFATQQGNAQKKRSKTPNVKPIDSKLFDSLEFRSIGPAFMSGRIADMAIDPTNENV